MGGGEQEDGLTLNATGALLANIVLQGMQGAEQVDGRLSSLDVFLVQRKVIIDESENVDRTPLPPPTSTPADLLFCLTF